MSYISFNIESIKKSYTTKINNFIDKNTYQISDGHDMASYINDKILLGPSETIYLFKAKIQEILDKINTRLDGKSKTYVKFIKNTKDNQIQIDLWILRTCLLYNLLIIAMNTFVNQELYNLVYKTFLTEDNKISYLQFNSDLSIENLSKFEIGIFGSEDPTSDIDIGIQYSGFDLNNPALAYIISRIEHLFLIFTQKNSLDFDIEMYANMLTISIPDSDGKLIEYYYLDSNTIDASHFNKMLKIAGNSIIRNIYLGYVDEYRTNNVETISKSITSLTIDKILTDIKISEIVNHSIIQNALLTNNNNWLQESKNIIKAFFTNDYHINRYIYYEKVNNAEKYKFDNIHKLFKEKNEEEAIKIIPKISKDVINNIIYLMGEADTYRMEGYTCVPSVIHVVRAYQKAKNTLFNDNTKKKTLFDKYESINNNTEYDEYCKNNMDNKLKDPYCNIGYYGYLLSILEQIGYIYRYCNEEKCKLQNEQNIQNCIQIYSQTCTDKKKKYIERVTNGLSNLSKLKKQNGGKRRKTKRNIRKKRNTKCKYERHFL